MRILLTTTKPERQSELERELEQRGHQIIPCKDDKSAQAAVASDHPPDIVITDWMLPDYNTADLCRAADRHSAKRSIYTIVISEKDQKEELGRILDSGAQDFILGPCNIDNLENRVKVAEQIVTNNEADNSVSEVSTRYANLIENLAFDREKQLVHVDRLSVIGTMATEVAHELNNPLAYIKSSLETTQIYWHDVEAVLRAAVANGSDNAERLEVIIERIPKALERMNNGLARIHKMVRALQTFAKKQKGAPGSCNPNQLVEAALEMCTKSIESYLRIQKDYDPNIPNITADSQEIEQVLINLFVNAAQAMKAQKQRWLKITTKGHASYAELLIEDNGPGIAVEHLDEIWKPFFTTKQGEQGTGLGLTISREIIESYGGGISVENRSEGGVRFRIILPLGGG